VTSNDRNQGPRVQIDRDLSRGHLMLEFMRSKFGDLRRYRTLDLGSGSGGISRALARVMNSVVCADINPARIRACQAKILAFDDGANQRCVIARAEALPFLDNSFDLIVLNGVLEWVGGQSASPAIAQKSALQEAERALRPGGHLYLAIENRLFPAFLLLDPHTHYPLVNMMPRRLARWLSGLTQRPVFSNYIYSYWGLRKLVEGSFPTAEFFMPVPHYHVPESILPLESRKRITAEVKKLLLNPDEPLKYRLTLLHDLAVARLSLTRLLTPYFVVVARKS